MVLKKYWFWGSCSFQTIFLQYIASFTLQFLEQVNMASLRYQVAYNKSQIAKSRIASQRKQVSQSMSKIT